MDSEYAKTLLRWHQAGAPNDLGDVPSVTKVEVLSRNSCSGWGRATQQGSTVPRPLSDGTDRDVTSLAAFFLFQ